MFIDRSESRWCGFIRERDVFSSHLKPSEGSSREPVWELEEWPLEFGGHWSWYPTSSWESLEMEGQVFLLRNTKSGLHWKDLHIWTRLGRGCLILWAGSGGFSGINHHWKLYPRSPLEGKVTQQRVGPVETRVEGHREKLETASLSAHR